MKTEAQDVKAGHIITRESLGNALEKFNVTRAVFDSDFDEPRPDYLTVSLCDVESDTVFIEVEEGRTNYALDLDDELEVLNSVITYGEIYDLLSTYSQEELKEVVNVKKLMYRVIRARTN